MITPEDIITVTEWIDSENVSYCGDILEVVAVDDNLVFTEILYSSTGTEGNIMLDLNRIKYRDVDGDFVDDVLKGSK